MSTTKFIYRNCIIFDPFYLTALTNAAIAIAGEDSANTFANARPLCAIGDATHTPVAGMVWVPTTIPMIQEMLGQVQLGYLPAAAILAFVRCHWDDQTYDDCLEYDSGTGAFTMTGPVHAFAGQTFAFGDEGKLLTALGLQLIPQAVTP